MAAGKRILVVTGGHRVAIDDFLGAIAEICRDRGWVWAHATQPTAQAWLDPAFAGCWDAILLHDIPGLALARGTEPIALPPGPGVAEALVGLLDSGQGVVVLHHAIAAWPAWEGWAEAIGGRFNYRPARMRGEDLPSSGYRMGTFTVEVADSSHPICTGIKDFAIDDELYFAPVLTDRVTPILTHDADMSAELFQDTFDVVTNGSSTGVTCAGHKADSALHGGHRLMGWTTTAGISPVATLLMGDGPSTFANPMFRTLLGNALDWVSSADAKNEAAAQPFAVPLP